MPAREFKTTCKPYQGRPGCGQTIIMVPTAELKPDGSPKYAAMNEDRVTKHSSTCPMRNNQQQQQPYPQSYKQVRQQQQLQQQLTTPSISANFADANRVLMLEQQVAQLAQQIEQMQMQIDSLLISKGNSDNLNLPPGYIKKDAGRDAEQEYGFDDH